MERPIKETVDYIKIIEDDSAKETKMNTKLISMFNVALLEKGASNNFKKINEKAIKCGYIVHPDCCTQSVAEFLEEQEFNPNSTFYKTWEDVSSKNRLELLFDQILHYVSTYGTEFKGETYIPNENPLNIPYKQFKVISPATKEEVIQRCLKLLESGIALSQYTLKVIFDFFNEANCLNDIDVDKIKNKEAQAILAKMLNRLPSDGFGILRCLVYNYTNSTVLIKNASMIFAIKTSTREPFDFSILSENQMIELSKIFYRFKPIFLALKKKNGAEKYINKIRKLAKKHHTPLKKNIWETCLIEQKDENLPIIEKEVENVSNFKKLRLMQSIKERILLNRRLGKMFIVRNGKMFVKKDYNTKCNLSYCLKLYGILEKSVINHLKTKATKVKLPKGIHLTCPTSEKNFIGNVPFGSYVDMFDDENIIGIYWRNEWGAHDLDLWFTDFKGKRYGWSGDYYSQNIDIVFSGDMTDADPEATEMFKLGKDVPDGNIGVNIYYATESNPKFKLFVAKNNGFCDKNDDFDKSKAYICDPNDIVFDTIISFDGCTLNKIGIVTNHRLFFANFGAGNSRVTSSAYSDVITSGMIAKAESCVELELLLKSAGFEIVDVADENEIVLDFTKLNKDDIIKLFD